MLLCIFVVVCFMSTNFIEGGRVCGYWSSFASVSICKGGGNHAVFITSRGEILLCLRREVDPSVLPTLYVKP